MKEVTIEWLKAAEDDLKAAKALMSEKDLTNVVAFHAQQVIEKCFKAVAEENGIAVAKTHDLVRLYRLIHENIGHLDEEILYAVNELYIDSRYPGELGLLPGGKPSTYEAEKFVLFADSMLKRIYHNYC